MVHTVVVTCGVVQVCMTCLEGRNKGLDIAANVPLSSNFLRRQGYLYHLDWSGYIIQDSFQLHLSSPDVVFYEVICHMIAWVP